MKMIRQFIVLVMCGLSLSLMADATCDSLCTTYSDGIFTTYGQTIAHCAPEHASKVIDDFIDQFRGDPNELFDWALRGLGQQGDDEKDAIILALKSTRFDKETRIGYIETDIVVPGFTTFKDLKIDSRVLKTVCRDSTIHVLVDVFYSNLFMKKAYGEFSATPMEDGRMLVSMSVNVRFGWFFRIFITKRKYQSMVDFRVAGFLRNMAREMEKEKLGIEGGGVGGK